MSRVTRRPEADVDLLEVAVYIGQDDLEASARFIDQLTERFEPLATQPEMGRARPELDARIRRCPVGQYVILASPSLTVSTSSGF